MIAAHSYHYHRSCHRCTSSAALRLDLEGFPTSQWLISNTEYNGYRSTHLSELLVEAGADLPLISRGDLARAQWHAFISIFTLLFFFSDLQSTAHLPSCIFLENIQVHILFPVVSLSRSGPRGYRLLICDVTSHLLALSLSQVGNCFFFSSLLPLVLRIDFRLPYKQEEGTRGK